MKIVITEEQYKILTENRVEKFKVLIKTQGTEKTIEMVGGWNIFSKVFNIKSPMDFLHLFDDLEQVQSEEKKDWTLFRYEKGNNLMIYDRKNGYVYIIYYEIWSFLEDKFELNYDEIQILTEKWLDEVYNLRGVTTKKGFLTISKKVG